MQLKYLEVDQRIHEKTLIGDKLNLAAASAPQIAAWRPSSGEDDDEGELADLAETLDPREDLRQLAELLGRQEEGKSCSSCPAGHPLRCIPVKLFVLCDSCKHVYLSGASVWRCVDCNWNRCEHCSDAEIAETVARLRAAADEEQGAQLSVGSTAVIRDRQLVESLEDALDSMGKVFVAEFENFLFNADVQEQSGVGREWDGGFGDSACCGSVTGLMPFDSLTLASARPSENSTAAPSSDMGSALEETEASRQQLLSMVTVDASGSAEHDSEAMKPLRSSLASFDISAADDIQHPDGARQRRLSLAGLGPGAGMHAPLHSSLPAGSEGQHETTADQPPQVPTCLHDHGHGTDPRACIADFYRNGSSKGPRGAISTPDSSDEVSEWFAVFRPTSADAIAKMVSRAGVGKGLNIKGKSSKQNRFSGFVPFLQISDNDHKTQLEVSPASAWIRIFYASEEDRQRALEELEPLLHLGHADDKEMVIYAIDNFPSLFGLEMPERVMREAYITKPDLSFPSGCETGRKSEPAFMDMNLHATRGNSEPQVVVYQADSGNPMNPHGLLMAYAEDSVKPVVSDFDAFTVGSRGIKYSPLCQEQQDLSRWVLDKTKEVLEKPGADNWTTRWFEVLSTLAQSGMKIDFPRCGFGDAASYALTEEIVDATKETGAVRHGAECFNFFFPQELDTKYLVVWHGFPNQPWEYRSEPDLRAFLIERANEGFAFPLNPVWPVRDPGWFEVHRALRGPGRDQDSLNAWYPPESGIIDKLEAIHDQFPDGFAVNPSASVHVSEPDAVTASVATSEDMCCRERCDFAIEEVRRKHARALMRSFSKSMSKLMVAGRHRGQAMALGMHPVPPPQPLRPGLDDDKAEVHQAAFHREVTGEGLRVLAKRQQEATIEEGENEDEDDGH